MGQLIQDQTPTARVRHATEPAAPRPALPASADAHALLRATSATHTPAADGLSQLLRTSVSGRAQSAVLQRYQQLAPAAGAAAAAGEYRVMGVGTEFEAQQVAGGAISGPTAPAANPQVRVSDDGRMAVEETNLTHRQPKVFYATRSVWKGGSQELARVQSMYELYADRILALEVHLANGTRETLDRVLPRVVASRAGVGARVASQEAMTMDVGPDCINVAQAVMNHAGDMRAPRLGIGASSKNDSAEFRTARAMVAWANTPNTGFKSLFQKAKSNAKTSYKKRVASGTLLDPVIANQIAVSYKNLMQNSPVVAAQVAQALGVNVYALANVGEAFETYRIANDGVATTRDTPLGKVRDFWGQHIGAVVAQSGGDRVTLENYARTHEVGQMEGDEARYYFQMYGSAATQTWHEAWTTGAGGMAAGPGIGLPADAGHDALTVVVRSRH